MPKKAELYGLTEANNKYKLTKLWSKNNFNSAFPVSLALYMRDLKKLNAKYIKVRYNAKEGKLETYVDEISINELFNIVGVPANEVFYNFQAVYEPYKKCAGENFSESIDLVVERRNVKGTEQLRPLEVKLTVVPNSATAKKQEKDWGCELVVRPGTTKYCAAGMVQSFVDKKVTERVKDMFNEFKTDLGGKSTKSVWDRYNEFEDDTFKEALIQLFTKISINFYEHQKPLVMQPIWKTNGQDLSLSNNAFDVFVWSDYALLYLLISNEFKDVKNMGYLTRSGRALMRMGKYMHEALGSDGTITADLMGIFDALKELSKMKDDKDTSPQIRPYLTNNASDDCLLTPRVKSGEIDKIINKKGIEQLKPERRLDQTIFFIKMPK